jgi:putative phage-type endonuclease
MLTDAEKRCIGGSDVAAICGVSPYAGPLTVWMRVVEGVEREDSTALRSGRHLEAGVRALYAEETGAEVVPDVRLSGLRAPYLRASLDGVAKVKAGGRRVLEVKTASASVAHRWGEAGTDEVPEEYLLQVQWYAGHGLDVGAVDEGAADVATLVAGEFRLYSVPFDAELFGVLLERVERFWVDYVVPKRPPPVTALPNDVEAVRAAYRRHTLAEHARFDALPPEAQVTVEEYLRAHAEEAAAKDRLALWETRLKLALAGAPGVVGLPEAMGVKRLDWKAEKAGRLNPWAALKEIEQRYDVADVLEKHTGQPNRPLRVVYNRGET